jgi:DNA-directed RNA polymerase subunit F
MQYTSLEELDARMTELHAEKDAIHEELRALAKQRDGLLVQDGWAAKIADMNPAERQALKTLLNVQIAEPKGVESAESVNGYKKEEFE